MPKRKAQKGAAPYCPSIKNGQSEAPNGAKGSCSLLSPLKREHQSAQKGAAPYCPSQKGAHIGALRSIRLKGEQGAPFWEFRCSLLRRQTLKREQFSV